MNLLLHMPSCLWGFQRTLIPCAILCLTSHSLFVEGLVVSFIFNIYMCDFWIPLGKEICFDSDSSTTGPVMFFQFYYLKF